jgi:hypothetical protein
MEVTMVEMMEVTMAERSLMILMTMETMMT